jgi:N-acetylglucosaminyl-diphospho-decaprenol L-rhamnosyltransferase
MTLPDVGRPPSIDYVVVAFRSERHLGSCLNAIAADRPEGAGIIVVDNASPDDGAGVAEGHASRPRLVRSDRNLGFGGACNLAVETSSADLVFFVNPDARLRRGASARLVAVMAADPAIAAAGPRIVDPAGQLSAASAGFEPSWRSALGHFLLFARIPVIGGFFPPLQLPPGRPAQTVDWVSGAAMMVRVDDFRNLGGFDASIFLYMEDVDLCRRLRGLGREIRYEASVEVEHDLGGSQGTEQSRRWYEAFHEYIARRRGSAYARAVSVLAALGLGLRAVALSRRRPAHARRLAIAARTAAGRALALSPTSGSTRA